MTLKDIARVCRLQQWVKNLFVFLPIFFDGKLFRGEMLWVSTVGFVAFCLAASGIYCFNDVMDIRADRLHPVKRLRPVASGAVPVPVACAISVMLLLASLVVVSGCVARVTLPLIILSAYIVANIVYCLGAKRIAIVDVFVVAVGYVLRVLLGGVVAGVTLSHWIVIMTFLLALFLAFAKRRDDVVMLEETDTLVRKNVRGYTLAFMNQVIGVLSGVLVVCYILYTVSPDVTSRLSCHNVYLTAVFVLAGIIRYMQITIVEKRSGSPTKVLFRDHFLQACIVLWVASYLLIIYVLG